MDRERFLGHRQLEQWGGGEHGHPSSGCHDGFLGEDSGTRPFSAVLFSVLSVSPQSITFQTPMPSFWQSVLEKVNGASRCRSAASSPYLRIITEALFSSFKRGARSSVRYFERDRIHGTVTTVYCHNRGTLLLLLTSYSASLVPYTLPQMHTYRKKCSVYKVQFFLQAQASLGAFGTYFPQIKAGGGGGLYFEKSLLSGPRSPALKVLDVPRDRGHP